MWQVVSVFVVQLSVYLCGLQKVAGILSFSAVDFRAVELNKGGLQESLESCLPFNRIPGYGK